MLFSLCIEMLFRPVYDISVSSDDTGNDQHAQSYFRKPYEL